MRADFPDADNLAYIKAGIDQRSFTGHAAKEESGQSVLRHNKSASNNSVPSSNSCSGSSGVSCVNKHSSFHVAQFEGSNAPESGYSTPLRNKKVVYEVIV